MQNTDINADANHLITLIYDGLEQSLHDWPNFIDQCLETFSASKAFLVIHRPTNKDEGMFFSSGQFADGELAHNTRLYQQLVENDPFSQLPQNKALTMQDLMSDQAIEQHPFYSQFMYPNHLYHQLGINMVEHGEEIASLRLFRDLGSDAFSEQDKSLCEQITPHISRALRIYSKLEKSHLENDLLKAVISKYALGIILIDQHARTCSINSQANEILSRNDGISLRNQHVHVYNLEQRCNINQTIHQLLNDPEENAASTTFAIQRPSGNQPLSLTISMLAKPSLVGQRTQPRIALLINDPEVKITPPLKHLKRLFNLTRAEANIAMSLTNGMSVEDISHELGISSNTVRTHLRTVFSKTGVNQQSKLVKLMLNSVVALS